jgi:hypothetical protein
MVGTFPHKRLRVGFSLGVALLMAVLLFGLEFHHHDDGDIHRDCPLCIALHQAQGGTVNSRPAIRPVPIVLSEFTPPPEINPVATAHILVQVIRPPPAA